MDLMGADLAHAVARRGANADFVRRLLDSGADPNQTGAEGLPAVVLAARVGNAEIVELLLARGARIGGEERPPVLELCSQPPLYYLVRRDLADWVWVLREAYRRRAAAESLNPHNTYIEVDEFDPIAVRLERLSGPSVVVDDEALSAVAAAAWFLRDHVGLNDPRVERVHAELRD